MRSVLALAVLALSCGGARTAAPAPPAAVSLEPFSVEEGGPYGYRQPGGEVAIPPRFQMAEAFSPEGIAAVVDEQGFAYIDRTGAVLVRPFNFDNGPDPFVEDLARCVDRGQYGFFDRHGRIAIAPAYDWAEPFSEGLATVCQGCTRVYSGEHWRMAGGRWGYIDRTGKLAIPLGFDGAGGFEGGRATVEVGGVKHTIDRSGAIHD